MKPDSLHIIFTVDDKICRMAGEQLLDDRYNSGWWRLDCASRNYSQGSYNLRLSYTEHYPMLDSTTITAAAPVGIIVDSILKVVNCMNFILS
ncbi:hypothetical protein AVEN_12409-1 [Araneus ventricosus]|uniref:Uncharacterized protein n=1 Tax=Araneus ventricosus TaxID=182803 RepID=A0A4Y2NKY6_ARAVE|nr:hypothetical protein AVEN_12409-1 [Araneus ventricosus]